MKRVLYAILVLVAFLGLVEGLGRALLEEPRPRHTFEDDSELGWVLPASTRFQFAGEWVTTNRWHMRGPEPEDSDKTLISLGDSSVFGHGVGDDEHFSARLDAALPHVRVLNAGVPGYACPQALGALRRAPVPIDGAVVYPGVSDSFVLDRKDQVALPAGLSGLRSSGGGRVLLEIVAARRIGTPRTSPADFEACLDALLEEVPHAVVVVPIAQGDLWGSTSWESPPVAHLLPYRQAMQRVAEAHGVPLIDLPAIVQDMGPAAEGVLLDPVHPSRKGHRVIAEEVEVVLRRQGFVQ